MADQTKTEAQAAADAPAKVAQATAEATQKVVRESALTAKKARAATARRTKRAATATKRAATAAKRKATRRAKTTQRPAASAPRQQRTETVNFNNIFGGFEAVPAFAPFQSLFAGAGERSQDAVRRSQQVAEQLADITRGNVEAFAEAGRVAAEGARSIGQDVVAKSREGVEQTAEAIRALAEAKSPTEFVQLQSEFARASFDRLVAESSRFTESMVKLAGEAIQPISNRATANAERLNSFVA